MRETEIVANFKLFDKKRRLKRKFQRAKYPDGMRVGTVPVTEPRNFPFVINKSYEEFTYDQLAVLNKGLKYRPPPEKIPLDEIVVKLSLQSREAGMK